MEGNDFEPSGEQPVDPFKTQDAVIGGALEDLAATQAAREQAMEARDEAASELPEPERTQSWQPNYVWDGDTSFSKAMIAIATLLAETDFVLHEWDMMVKYGDLDPAEVGTRSLTLNLRQRVLLFSAVQVLGVLASDYRTALDPILALLEEAAQPTEAEDAILRAAGEKMTTAMKSSLIEQLRGAGVAVYTEEEILQQKQAEQDAGLN